MQNFFFSSLFFAVLFVSAQAHAGHDHNHEHDHDHDETPSNVVVLTDANFEEVLSNNELVFVEFYAPWCGHCKRLEPEYELTASNLAQDGVNVIVAKLDATEHPVSSGKHGIRGYPTIKFFNKGIPSDYEGGRTASEMTQWLKKKSGPATIHLTSKESLDTFLAQPLPKIIAYITDEELDAWSTAANSGKLDGLAIAHVTDSSLYGDHAVKTVVIVKPGESDVVYNGEFTAEGVVAWGVAEGHPLVDELAQKIWLRSSQTGLPLLAVFLATLDEESNALLRAIATPFKGKVLTSYSTTPALAERWGTSGKVYPTGILVQWNGQEPKMTIYDEESAPFTVDAALAFVESSLNGEYKTYKKSEPLPESNDGPVKIVVTKNFDDIVLDTDKDVFVEFYAPWCAHCKNLAPIWDELGKSYADVHTVTIAKMDATANSAPESLDIKGFPTLIFFPADNKAGIPYNGDRDLDSFKDFVGQHASRSIKQEL